MSDRSLYEGLVPTDPNELTGQTMSSEELERWQGKDGEIYRGLKPTDPNELTGRTMSEKEFISWQGENGEIYRGMVPEDPDKYRMETTGTSDVELGKMVDDFIRATSLTEDGMKALVTQLANEPQAINKLIEQRYHKTGDFLFSYGDWNIDRISADLDIVSNLLSSGYDFSTFKIQPSNEIGDNTVVDFLGFLDHYLNGVSDKRANGKNVKIPNPFNKEEMVYADELLQHMEEYYKKLMESKKEQEAPAEDIEGPKL